VNFTDSVNGPMSSSPVDVFATLSRRQSVAYSAVLNVDSHQILSFSPELFFKVEDGRIVTRPMKGTMPRGRDSLEDIKVAASLRSDEKNRAEHVMSVDLLRNDLGRICNMGSVQVEDIFSVEKYRTLFQMTSTISGKLGLRSDTTTSSRACSQAARSLAHRRSGRCRSFRSLKRGRVRSIAAPLGSSRRTDHRCSTSRFERSY
jgi:anthranilate/para-aminobenzoate synthase component I